MLRLVCFGGCSPAPCICILKGPCSSLHKPSHTGIFPWIPVCQTGWLAGPLPGAFSPSGQRLSHLMHMGPWGQPLPHLSTEEPRWAGQAPAHIRCPLSLCVPGAPYRAPVWVLGASWAKWPGGRGHRRGVRPGGRWAHKWLKVKD